MTKARQNWGKDYKKLPKLDLVGLQVESYKNFLTNGIRESLDEINNVTGVEDFTGKNWSIKFGDYRFGEPKYTVAQAKEKSVNYDTPLYVEAHLTNKRTEEEQTQEVFLGDIPKMTATGTFLINGIERAVVTQLVRSPGVFFSGKVDDISGKTLYQSEIRPQRGSWLEIATTRRDVLTVKIDRKRKMPVTVLLRAIGLSTNDEILEEFKDILDKDELNLLNNTLEKDSTLTQNEALIELYEKMRPR